jgi:hypothetical protein
MRRCATSERTMTPAKTSTGLVQVIPRLAGKHDHRARVVSATLTSCDGASATPCRWRVQKCKLDNKSQLKGRMTGNLTGTPRPTLVDNSLTIFGDALAPSALFAIGLGLSFEDVRVNFRPSMLLVVIKLVVLLALVWGSPCYSASITTSQLRRWCTPPRLPQRPPISWRASTTARGRSSPRQYR